MASWKCTFNDRQIAAVLSYVRNNWDNKAPAVTEEQVKAIRAKEKARTALDRSGFATHPGPVIKFLKRKPLGTRGFFVYQNAQRPLMVTSSFSA